MNTATSPSTLKSTLQELVSWMEKSYGNPTQGAGSDFAMEPSPEIMAMGELALAAAMNGHRPVYLATSWPVKSVIGALVLGWAGVTRAQIFKGGFGDNDFQALVEALIAVKSSNLVIESAVDQLGLDASANH